MPALKNNNVDILLAIDCSGELCSVAMKSAEKIFLRQSLAPREHAYLVLPFIEALLLEAGVQFSDLQAIAFGQGPGAFTGLRVAAAMTQGLALAQNLPVIPVCSLRALANQLLFDEQAATPLQLEEGTHVVATLDARMSELYWALFIYRDGELIQEGEVQLSLPENIYLSKQKPAMYLGSGCRHLHDLLSEQTAANFLQLGVCENWFPRADSIARIASSLLLEGNLALMHKPAVPVYVRNDVAKKKNQQA